MLYREFLPMNKTDQMKLLNIAMRPRVFRTSGKVHTFSYCLQQLIRPNATALYDVEILIFIGM